MYSAGTRDICQTNRIFGALGWSPQLPHTRRLHLPFSSVDENLELIVGINVALKGPFPLAGESELSRNFVWAFTPKKFARNTNCRSQLLECWVVCVWLAFLRFYVNFSVCHISLAIARFAPLHSTTRQQILHLSFFLSRR
jgi:hypothetical protein